MTTEAEPIINPQELLLVAESKHIMSAPFEYNRSGPTRSVEDEFAKARCSSPFASSVEVSIPSVAALPPSAPFFPSSNVHASAARLPTKTSHVSSSEFRGSIDGMSSTYGNSCVPVYAVVATPVDATDVSAVSSTLGHSRGADGQKRNPFRSRRVFLCLGAAILMIAGLSVVVGLSLSSKAANKNGHSDNLATTGAVGSGNPGGQKNRGSHGQPANNGSSPSAPTTSSVSSTTSPPSTKASSGGGTYNVTLTTSTLPASAMTTGTTSSNSNSGGGTQTTASPPSPAPTSIPTHKPTKHPNPSPTSSPTRLPTPFPTPQPTSKPTPAPTIRKTSHPTAQPTTSQIVTTKATSPAGTSTSTAGTPSGNSPASSAQSAPIASTSSGSKMPSR